MFQNLKNKITLPTTAIGLYLHLYKDGSKAFNICVLEKKGTEVNILEQEQNLTSLSDSTIQLDKKWPVALTIAGKGILTKKIQTSLSTPEETLSKAIPNADYDQFCFESIAMEKQTVVTLARKDFIAKQVESIEAERFQVLFLSLGVSTVQYLLPILPVEQATCAYGDQKFRLEHNQLFGIEKGIIEENTSQILGNNTISAKVLPAFSTALGLFVSQQTAFFPADYLNEKQESYNYQKLFQFTGWAMLLSLLSLLLINFMAFSWLGQKNSEQTITLSYHKKQLAQLQTLRADIADKQSFFNGNNILKSSKTSFYADDIGASLPDGIRLGDVAIFPVASDKKSRKEKKTYERHLIRLKGESQRSTILNGWIKDLKAKEWVDKVKVLPYEERKDGTGVFELEVFVD